MDIFKLFAILVSMLATISCANMDTETLMKTAESVLENNSSGLANPSQQEISQGLKEALQKGIQLGAEKASKTDGFLKNDIIKILLPPEARQAESTLRSLGLGQLADQALTSINRAAEDSARSSIPIFTQAISELKFQDVMNILTGPQNAATEYLKNKTTSELIKNFQPKISESLNKVSATKYWSDFAQNYNQIPLVKKLDTNLESYVTNKAISGLFTLVATEELKIRQNPVARTSDLLKKVFGFADKQKSESVN